jgi:hypothetical protein
MELGIQGDCFDPVAAVASPLNADLAEDGKLGTRASLFQAGKFLVQVSGRIAPYNHGRTDVPRTGHVQERLEQPSPDYQELPEGGLLDLMNGLMLIGSVLEVFDECPKCIEPFIDALRASPLLGSGREIKLDGGNAGGEHNSGSSPMRGFLDLSTFGTIPHWGSPFEALFCEA